MTIVIPDTPLTHWVVFMACCAWSAGFIAWRRVEPELVEVVAATLNRAWVEIAGTFDALWRTPTLSFDVPDLDALEAEHQRVKDDLQLCLQKASAIMSDALDTPGNGCTRMR